MTPPPTATGPAAAALMRARRSQDDFTALDTAAAIERLQLLRPGQRLRTTDLAP